MFWIYSISSFVRTIYQILWKVHLALNTQVAHIVTTISEKVHVTP